MDQPITDPTSGSSFYVWLWLWLWPWPWPWPWAWQFGDFKLHLRFPWISPDAHLVFTWQSPDHQTIIWPSPDPYLTLISSFHLKNSCLVGGGLVDQPITNLTSGSSFYVWRLTFDFDPDPDPDPELDNYWQVPVQSPSPSQIKERERGIWTLGYY